MQFRLAWEQRSREFTHISLRLSPRPLPTPASHAKGQGPRAAAAGEALAGGAPEKEGREESTCC